MSIELNTINILNILLLLGVIQGLIVSGILLLRKPFKISERLLGFWIIAFALSNLYIILLSSNLSSILGQRFTLLIPLSYELFYGPLIFLFVKSLTENGYRIKKDAFHLVPGLLKFLYYLIIYVQPLSFRQTYYGSIHWPLVEPSLEVLSYCSFVIYLWMTFKQIGQLKLAIENQYSEANLESYGWLKRLIGILGALALIWGILTIADVFFMGYSMPFIYFYPYYLLIVFISYFVGFTWVSRSRSTQRHIPLKPTQKSSMRQEELSQLANRLQILMQEEQLFLSKDLRARTLADRLEISTHALSEVFNLGMNYSFHTYVNSLRVEHVKKQLISADLEKVTLVGIALDSGFNSESSFFRIFKDITGVTPKTFVSQLKRTPN